MRSPGRSLLAGSFRVSVVAVVASQVIGVAPVSAAQAPTGPFARAAVTSNGAELVGDSVARRWRVTPGSVGAVTGTAGAVTSSLFDPLTGAEHDVGDSPDFTIDVNGGTLTSASGWTQVSVVAGTAPADPGRGAGPAGQDPATLTFTYTSSGGLTGYTITRQYRLSPGDAMIEVRTSLQAGGAPVVISGYSVDQVVMSAQTPSASVIELHSGSSYTSRHETTHIEVASVFDDQGEVVVRDDGVGQGVVVVNQRRSGPSTRMTATAVGSGVAVAAAAEPGRELGIIPVEAVTGTDSDNSLPNPAYPAGGRVETVGAGTGIDLGAAYLGVFSGGDDLAPAVIQRHLSGSVLASAPVDVEQNTFHPFGGGVGMTSATMLAQAKAARGLGANAFVLDDGWEGGTGGLAGDWRLDPVKFPSSSGGATPDFVPAFKATGMRLGLWMETLLFNSASQAYRAHPEWACAPTGDASGQIPNSDGFGYWDATNTAWQTYMTGVVDRLIADYGVGELKLDNEQWMDCGTSSYTQYERAWEGLVASWRVRHPEVVFQLDETIDQRSFPYKGLSLGPTWFEDDHVKNTSHPGATKLSQELSDLWQVAPWVPPSQLGVSLFDGTLSSTSPDGSAGYQLPFALLGQATFWTDTTALTSGDAAETRWWTTWYAAHRAAYSGLVYRDSSSDPIDGSSPAVLQPWDPSTRSGYLTVVRQGDTPGPESIGVHVRDVDPSATYQLSDVRTGEILGSYTGSSLAAGVPIPVAAPYTTRVIAVTPAATVPTALPEGRWPVLVVLAGFLAAGVVGRRVFRRRSLGACTVATQRG